MNYLKIKVYFFNNENNILLMHVYQEYTLKEAERAQHLRHFFKY